MNSMETNQRGKIGGGLASMAAGLNPMNSFTFLLALGLIGVAAWVWFHQSGDPRPPFPLYGIIAGCYAGGFLIGRVFRKIVKTAAILAAITMGALTLLNYAHVDTLKAKQTVKAGSAWVHDEANRLKDLLLRLLPSGGAAGVGVFAGARRRHG